MKEVLISIAYYEMTVLIRMHTAFLQLRIPKERASSNFAFQACYIGIENNFQNVLSTFSENPQFVL